MEVLNWDSVSTLPQNGIEKGLSNSMKWIDLTKWLVWNRCRQNIPNYRWWTNMVHSDTTTFQNNNAVTFTDVSAGVSAGEDINWTSDGGATWFTKTGQISGEIVSAASAEQIQGKFFFVTGSEVYKTDNFGDSFVH
ncbi:MAG: hypothetical protein MZV64_32305 [Ignavibacteriales bacterium]|nr:hypothetical protein [Ignavibacteriales bacterium]